MADVNSGRRLAVAELEAVEEVGLSGGGLSGGRYDWFTC